MANSSSHYRFFEDKMRHPGETVVRVVWCKFGSKKGNLVLTNNRLVFVRDGWFGTTSRQIPLRKISEVQASTGLTGNTLRVDSTEFRIQGADACREFESTVTDLLHGRSVEVQQPQSVGAQSAAPLDENPDGPPWYDSTILVAFATVFLFPLGIWGLAQRSNLETTGQTHYWEHSVPLWLLAFYPMTAPVAGYGFWKRKTEGGEGAKMAGWGLILAGVMSFTLVTAVGVGLGYQPKMKAELLDSDSDREHWTDKQPSDSNSDPESVSEPVKGPQESEKGVKVEEEPSGKDEKPSVAPVVPAKASINAGGEVAFQGWSVDFQDAFRSQRNGDATPQSGHTFLTVPYKLKNEAPSTRRDPMASLVVFDEAGQKYKNRNATGRSEHAAKVRGGDSTVQWQTFELPKDVVASTFYVAFEDEAGEFPFKMEVSPGDVKNP